MLKKLNHSMLPSDDRFVRVTGEDGVCYHIVNRALCNRHISDLTEDGYSCQIVSREEVPPCRCCYFGATLSTYQDASWLDGQDTYFEA